MRAAIVVNVQAPIFTNSATSKWERSTAYQRELVRRAHHFPIRAATATITGRTIELRTHHITLNMWFILTGKSPYKMA